MYKINDFTKKLYKVSELAKILNVSIQTIQNYLRLGKLDSIKEEGQVQLVTRESILKYLQSIGNLHIPERNILLVETVEQAQEFHRYRNVKNLSTILYEKENNEKVILNLMDLIINEQLQSLYIFCPSLLKEKSILDSILDLSSKNNINIEIFKKEGNYNDIRTK